MPGTAQYNLPAAWRLDGPLSVPALEQALQEIVRRHEVLRTRFAVVDGEPHQVVQDHIGQPLIFEEDLRHLSSPDCETEIRRRIQQAAARPFNLETGPLLRVQLWRKDDQQRVLLLTMHHIVSDGWSAEVLVRELNVFYEAFHSPHDNIRLPADLPLQYADYALWQRNWMQGDVVQQQLTYWKRQLAGAPVLTFPTDRPRPAVMTGKGALLSFQLPPRLSMQLKQLAGEQNVSLFMLLLAAWQTLLGRYSGQTDVVVGVPIANRTRSEIEGLIGFFVNMLPLRTDLAGNPGFVDLLTCVRTTALEAYAHQDVPFEQLVETLEIERDLGRDPLVQTLFTWQNTPATQWQLGDVVLQPMDWEPTTARFDFNLTMEENNGGLQAWIDYCVDLFDHRTMQQVARHFETLLQGLVTNPDSRLRDLPLLTAGERTQLLVDWNDTAAPYSGGKCLQQLFEEQAARTPDAVAVVFGDRQLTYRCLDEQACRLARALQQRGLHPGMPVGVWMQRSDLMIVSVLAVLKAGGYYVPVETQWPQARIAHIFDSLKVRHLLTDLSQLDRAAELQADLPDLTNLLCTDEDEAWRDLPADPLNVAHDSRQTAYVIHTSGSTGQPKGVVLTHQPVVNLIEWVNTTFQVGPADRLLFATSLCFDLSVYDIFGLLAAGGSLHVASAEDLSDPQRLVDLLLHEPVTFWDSAPAMLQQLMPLMPDGPTAGCHTLRRVFLSGDWIPVSLPDAVRHVFPHAQVISLGGATEAAIWSNFFPIETIDPAWTSIPYGRPIQNARYYILDDALQPCPVGVPGHLYIGGECLARGYVQPGQTAERFLPDPYAATPGARMYLTGDRARFGPDGNIEFLGRTDQQVKIRGFRIEPGEIEIALTGHSLVQDAVVLAREDRPGHKRLVAWVVMDATAADSDLIADLREHLKSRLPDYMIPAAFVVLDRLPVTANGKLDRTALPDPQLRGESATRRPGEFGGSSHEQSAPPRNPVEEQLCEIWQSVLGRDHVGVHDNFFEAGGHSLLATQVVSRIRNAFHNRNAAWPETVSAASHHQSAWSDHSEACRRCCRTKLPPPRHRWLPQNGRSVVPTIVICSAAALVSRSAVAGNGPVQPAGRLAS